MIIDIRRVKYRELYKKIRELRISLSEYPVLKLIFKLLMPKKCLWGNKPKLREKGRIYKMTSEANAKLMVNAMLKLPDKYFKE